MSRNTVTVELYQGEYSFPSVDGMGFVRPVFAESIEELETKFYASYDRREWRYTIVEIED